MSVQDDQLAIAILRQMDITIFRRLAPWRYELFGEPPESFANFFGRGTALSETFWTQSEMLDFFIYDVEEFFERGETSGSVSSGVWHETGADQQEVSFVAYALELSGENLLIVRTLGEEYQEKVRILQRARENLLERRSLGVDLNEYKQKSRRDGLTGLFNRATFNDLLRENMAISEKTGATFSLILIDVDDFKNVNDTQGHVAGDMVLSGIGQLLQSILRREDAACRYGGEEFAVLVQYITQNQVANTAEKIRARIESHQFDKLPHNISVSIGCSTYQPIETAESFINRADVALYEAKRGGKNRVVVN
ncbi:MAG: GGDEF domain-containing protein [Candidatus Accumulibacter sp.]|jgi:diguanylate cyclase (GGDEF)-like protein|nr:GGDEF domain-containing protein [Accumulibacter sp.]